MSKYELVVILDAQLTQGEKDDIIKQVSDTVGKCEAKVINSQVWIEKQKLTFRIKRCSEGTYYLINIECTGAAANDIRKNLRINERILRFAIFKTE